jgi:hypothetical protein
MTDTDLFISYSSHDELWAKKFFFDLKSRFPTVKPFWARDVAAIPPGEPFRPIFQGAAQDATYFVVFFSAAAQRSNEVGPEIQAFLQSRQNKSRSNAGVNRRLFYVPLEAGVDYGGLVDIQGFPDFQTVYKPKTQAPDTGISSVASNPERDLWVRMVGAIGHRILDDQKTKPITLVLLVMTTANKDNIDLFLNLRLSKYSPTLSELLQSLNLTLGQAKSRYDDTAMTWRPFGTDKTIIDLMQDVREAVHRDLGIAEGFHWKPLDLVDEVKNAADIPARDRLIESLSVGPSVVITDPISLYNPEIKSTFALLSEHAKNPQSIILSIAPVELQAAEHLYNSLLSTTTRVVDPHLYPPIPSTETFALCGMNVQHAADVVRLLRSGLGYYYLRKKKEAVNPLLSSGT